MGHARGGDTYCSQSRVRDCSSLSASHRVTRGPHAGNTSDNQTHTTCVYCYMWPFKQRTTNILNITLKYYRTLVTLMFLDDWQKVAIKADPNQFGIFPCSNCTKRVLKKISTIT